jgi:hypothetical protein
LRPRGMPPPPPVRRGRQWARVATSPPLDAARVRSRRAYGALTAARAPCQSSKLVTALYIHASSVECTYMIHVAGSHRWIMDVSRFDIA